MNSNIARHLDRMAAAQPATAALKVPRARTSAGDIDYLTLSFSQLAAETEAWRTRIEAAGVRRGDRVLVMVKAGLPLIASAFALFKAGAVPVIIDPGMGLRSFLEAVKRSQPRALLGIPLALAVSRVFPGAFRSVAVRVGASASPTARLGLESSAKAPREAVPAGPRDLAAILFTSGSTGTPKGVCYEHGMFEAQVGLIRDLYHISPGEIDLPLLPIFALFNPALGMTSVIPEIDPRKPAQADPAKIVQAIQQEGVTNSFGSPTLWRKVAAHCAAHALTLPTLKRVLCAGAPVPADLWEASRGFLTQGVLHSPYGATEALPVSTVSAAEVDPASIRGACVGRPVPGVEVRLIALSDGPLKEPFSGEGLAPGEVGEIVVKGPVVTREYDALPEATAMAKIADRNDPGALWHRMGDCGFMGEDGRLWFLGRKVERVRTEAGILYTEPCEQVFRAHPRARRCALIGSPFGPALVAETAVSGAAARALAQELRELAQRHPHTQAIATFYFKKRFPVDVRHNAKIHRLALARWAGSAKAYRGP